MFETTNTPGPFNNGSNLTTDKLLSKADWKNIYKHIAYMFNSYTQNVQTQTIDKTLTLKSKPLQCYFGFENMSSGLGCLITNLLRLNNETQFTVFIFVRIAHVTAVCNTRNTTRTEEVNIVPRTPSKNALNQTTHVMLSSNQPVHKYCLRENPVKTIQFQILSEKKKKKKRRKKRLKKRRNMDLTVSVPRTKRNQPVKISIRRKKLDDMQNQSNRTKNNKNQVALNLSEEEEDDDCIYIPTTPPPMVYIESTDDETED